MAFPKADIISLSAPGYAFYRQEITVVVIVENDGDEGYIDCTLRADTAEVDGGSTYLLKGEIYTYYFKVIMPNKDLEIRAYAWHWDGANWIQDDEEKINVRLEEYVFSFGTPTITAV